MGRYNFAPQNVHKHAQQLLNVKRISSPPPWYQIIGSTPPSTRLVRPAMQRDQRPGAKPNRKKSRTFQPLPLSYEEDSLRWEYFNDHPWELARPRVILEGDGRDHEKWDWSLPLDYTLTPWRHADKALWRRMDKQASRPVNGESVIQRQNYLVRHERMTEAAAYDKARKELYRYRHAKEVEARVAREEALAVGAYFGLGPLEIGMQLEDQKYENWREWAKKQIQSLKALQGSAYTGTEELEGTDDLAQAAFDEVSSAVPASQGGQKAMGGAAVHP